MNEQNKERVLKVIFDTTSVERSDWEYNWTEKPEDTKLFEDLGFDSLDSIEALMKLEKEFNIAINDDDFSQVETLGDIFEFLTKYHGL